MPNSQSQLDYVLDQLSFLPKLTYKKMFEEYAFYSDSNYIGLIYDDKVFLKTLPELIELIGDDEIPAYPGSKNSLHIPDEIFENKNQLAKLFKL